MLIIRPVFWYSTWARHHLRSIFLWWNNKLPFISVVGCIIFQGFPHALKYKRLSQNGSFKMAGFISLGANASFEFSYVYNILPRYLPRPYLSGSIIFSPSYNAPFPCCFVMHKFKCSFLAFEGGLWKEVTWPARPWWTYRKQISRFIGWPTISWDIPNCKRNENEFICYLSITSKGF